MIIAGLENERGEHAAAAAAIRVFAL